MPDLEEVTRQPTGAGVDNRAFIGSWVVITCDYKCQSGTDPGHDRACSERSSVWYRLRNQAFTDKSQTKGQAVLKLLNRLYILRQCLQPCRPADTKLSASY